MVQTFMVVQCVDCQLFQVQQVKKSSNKWTCKVCTTKQSVIKKYYEGQAADCRKRVQQLNMKKGELEQNEDRLLMPPDEYASYREDEVAEDNVIQPLPPTVIQADKSKWSLYMHPKDELDVDVKDTSRPQEFEQVSKKVKRDTSMISLNMSESSNPYSQRDFHTSLYSLNSNHVNSSVNNRQSKQLVQGLKEITGSKSTYDISSEFSADSTRSIQRLTDSVAGIDEGNISLLNTAGGLTGDHNNFAQGRRASLNPTPITSKWHKFTDSSKNTSKEPLAAFSTSDLDHFS